MTHTRLRNRRRHQSITLDWRGQKWILGIGLNERGEVKEIFLNGPHAGSDQEALAQDGAVLASLLLQSGFDVHELVKHLAREGMTPDSPAASLLGIAAIKAAELEAEYRETVDLAGAVDD